MAHPQYPLARLHSPDDVPVETASGDPVYVRTDPRFEHERMRAAVLELDIDSCANTFGTLPCAATGEQCYNSFQTCKDREHFIRVTRTYAFALRGTPVPAGKPWRPYIARIDIAPTQISTTSGLALRSQTTVTLVDEGDNDTEGDPYKSARSTPALGTFWTRFMARNRNAVGRPARIRRGFYAEPFSDVHWIDEGYLIEAIRGPDASGTVQVVLSDPLKLLDKAMLPAATDGKLLAQCKAVAFSGVVVSATATTVTLPADAQPVNGAYDGMEIAITANTGTGQTRKLSGYSGADFTANVNSAWSVTPDATSRFEIRPLKLTLAPGKADLYPAPTVSKRQFVRIGSEIIEYTAKSADVLSWPAHSYRGLFGSAVEDHDANAAVQMCRAWVDVPAQDVVQELLNASGVIDPYIDLVALAAEAENWLQQGRITACVGSPTKASQLVNELAMDLNLLLWWEPVAQKVKCKVNMPAFGGAAHAYTSDNIIQGSTDIERLDQDRITRAAEYYALRDATASLEELPNFQRAEVRIDTDAESDLEYNDQRANLVRSRWMSAANVAHVMAMVARRVIALRDAPYRIELELDKRETPCSGALVDITTPRLNGPDGAPRTVRCRVVRLKDAGTHYELQGVSTTFANRRWAWIAPGGQPNYGSATEAQRQYAYISNSSRKMSNGDDGYTIL